ncbi:MAG TPA: hypothetical protein VFV87_20755 [Pirellulaceae bacterium]|nr:hypothetical protein [Pirellulaceae bacterium]
MNEQGVIRRISWRDLFPWLILLRTFRIAISPTLLALAILASIVSFLGWRLAGLAFNPEAVPGAANSTLYDHLPPAARQWLPEAPTAVLEGYFSLAEPLARLFRVELTLRQTAYYAFGTLLTLAIWAFVGGVITRRAVVELGTEMPPGIQSSVTYAGRRYLWYFLTPLYPLLGIVLLAIPIALVGLPLRAGSVENLRWLHDLGVVLAGLVWILVAIAGLAALWLFGGLIFGWPLMWPAISAEKDGDPFEAFSRSFSYVYGKPLHYAFYVLVAATFGALCWAVVDGATQLVEHFGFWALAWGGGGEHVLRIRELASAVADGRSRDLGDREYLLSFGTLLMGLVVRLMRSVTAAFAHTYFWCAASAIYLLLRMDVDHQEIDEVYLEDDPEKAPAPLPTETAAPAPLSSPPPAPAADSASSDQSDQA